MWVYQMIIFICFEIGCSNQIYLAIFTPSLAQHNVMKLSYVSLKT